MAWSALRFEELSKVVNGRRREGQKRRASRSCGFDMETQAQVNRSQGLNAESENSGLVWPRSTLPQVRSAIDPVGANQGGHGRAQSGCMGPRCRRTVEIPLKNASAHEAVAEGRERGDVRLADAPWPIAAQPLTEDTFLWFHRDHSARGVGQIRSRGPDCVSPVHPTFIRTPTCLRGSRWRGPCGPPSAAAVRVRPGGCVDPHGRRQSMTATGVWRWPDRIPP